MGGGSAQGGSTEHVVAPRGRRWAMAASALLAPSFAWASSFGVGAGATFDLPDPAGLARIPVAANVVVPLRVDLTEHARVRTALHVAGTRGIDTVTWQVGDGRQGEESVAYFLSGSLLLGAEVSLPTGGAWAPYLAATAGPALTVTGHTQWVRFEHFDPAYYTIEDLLQRGTINPFSRQVVLATDLAIGVASDLLWVEAAYGSQFLDAAPLRRSTPSLDIRREAYAWNGVRLTVGVSTTFGARPTAE